MQILSNYTTSQVIDHIKVYSPQTLLIELQFQKAWKKKKDTYLTQDIKIRSFVAKTDKKILF